jgi:glycosyltransferase involved in cell wall biosynthesis
MSSSLRVHCELAPVLINRTAVYRICRQVPAELTKRGMDARPFALLSKLNDRVEPEGKWGRRSYRLSEWLLHSALRHHGRFLAARPALHPVFRGRRLGALPLVLDPLYLLFHGELTRGVVIVYDTTPVTDPAWHSPGVGRLYKVALKLLARGGCHVVACSRNTAAHLRVNHGIAPSRVTVLPLGLFGLARETQTRRADPGAPGLAGREPFLLFVGNIEPRKNVHGLVRAYQKADLYRRHGVRLRIIGTICDPEDPVIAQAGSVPGIDLLGFVDDETLAKSYRDCLGFVYPSYCEGFGLPLLEAMCHGCACLATLAGASPEVGGDSVLYVNPYADEDIAAGMLKLVQMPTVDRERLGRRGQERAQGFTWERFYDGLAGVLRREADRCFAGSGGSYCGAAA